MATQKHKEVYCQDDIWEDLQGKQTIVGNNIKIHKQQGWQSVGSEHSMGLCIEKAN
jgi:hypothetical protein